MSCAKTAEPIKMLFGMWTWVGPRKHVLDEGAYWRSLANVIEPSMCSGDVAICQITLTASYYLCRAECCFYNYNNNEHVYSPQKADTE